MKKRWSAWIIPELIGAYLIFYGLTAMLGFTEIDLTRMSSRDGLIAVLTGTVGILFCMMMELKEKVKSLERER